MKMNRQEFMDRYGEDLNDMVPTYISADGVNDYLAFKMGTRWVCDGPNGRFHARTKQQLIEMLRNGGLSQ